MLTIAQIYAVVALLLAFNVPMNEVQTIQTMLGNEQPAVTQPLVETPLASSPAPVNPDAPMTTLNQILVVSNGSYQPIEGTVIPLSSPNGASVLFDIKASDPIISAENLTYTWVTDNEKNNSSGQWNEGGKQFNYSPTKVGTTTLMFTVNNGTETTELPIDVTVK